MSASSYTRVRLPCGSVSIPTSSYEPCSKSFMSPTSAEEHGNISPTSSSPPRPGFQHGGKRIRNSDRSVYETTNFSRQPHPTILKRITWQDVLGGPYLSLPEAERRRVANQIRAAARNLAQLLVVNNSTPPTYTDMETCTVTEPPWVPDFFESERDWRPSVPKVQVCSPFLIAPLPLLTIHIYLSISQLVHQIVI